MKKEDFSKYKFRNLYLREFYHYDVDQYITFNIVGIDTEKMIINIAITNRGKISVVEYDLLLDEDNNLYFTYGIDREKIEVDDFEEIND